jgi:hypothetical protein
MSDQDYSTEEFQRLIHRILAAEKNRTGYSSCKAPRVELRGMRRA